MNRWLETVIDRAERVQAEGKRMARLVRIVGELRQFETRDEQKVVLLAGPPRLSLDRREVVRVSRGPESETLAVTPQQVVGDAKDVDAVPAIQVDELGHRQEPVAPRRVGVKLAEEQVGSHGLSVAAACESRGVGVVKEKKR
ncbi:MAG: hypothetical protein ACRDNP_03010 [Gaiellaceae bacterium]